MSRSRTRPGGARRVQRHRSRLARGGKTRVEVTVPTGDVKLMRSVADRLRAGGEEARAVRSTLGHLLAGAPARSAEELLAFFRASPLVGVDLRIERDKSPGREPAL